MKKKTLVVLFAALLVAIATAFTNAASATTYHVSIGANDYVQQRLACNNHLVFNVQFGADRYAGGNKGIDVKAVRIINYVGAPIRIQANFHNMGGYGGQGHRDLSDRVLQNNQSILWTINTPFWFAGASQVFSSTVNLYGFSCGTWQDLTLWHGPTH
jgi:hypothetical protein